MEARTAHGFGLVGREDPEDEVLAEVELSAKPPEQLDLRLERLRILVRPRHPRPQVVEARVDRILQQRRVPRLPAANDEALGFDPIGRRLRQNSSSFRAASTTRSGEGMYASSICQYGYGTS